ncbi:MAG: hypothetical protein IPJ30_26545 [Acidobacteria bacterium]|nr:hypothetical protein [Acidobacteriota bacterium]
MKIKEILEELRKLIDGEESGVQQMEDLLEGENGVTRSESEEFFKKMMKEIDFVLRKEIVRLPTGNAYIPNGFMVFLNPTDYKNVPKDKRKFAEKEMGKLLVERSKELVGSMKVSTEFIKLIIKPDASLENGRMHVEAISSEISQTLEFAFQTNKDSEQSIKNHETIDDFSTIIDDDFCPLYWLEIWHSGKKINKFPILHSEISIGRDYEGSKAHIRLKTDNQKISSLHGCSN